MTKITQFTSKEKLQAQACLWISRIDRGCTDEETQEISLWVNKSKAHRDALMKMASLWDDLSVLNELSALFPLEKVSKRVPFHLKKIALAASFLFVALLGGLITTGFTIPSLSSFNQQVSLLQTFSTKIGEQAIFSLSDGTSIQLNTNSTIEVSYSKRQRQVKLVQGEAKFDVAKDSTRPFSVLAGEKYFTALGTIFNVQKIARQEVELLVTEGKVLITKPNAVIDYVSQKMSVIKLESIPGVLVQSGEKAIIKGNSLYPINKVSLIQIQRDLAWQQGMLIFAGEPMEQALKEISRYTNINFEIIDDKLAQLLIAGYFKADDIDGLLNSLSLNFNIYHQKTSTNIIRLSSEKF